MEPLAINPYNNPCIWKLEMNYIIQVYDEEKEKYFTNTYWEGSGLQFQTTSHIRICFLPWLMCENKMFSEVDFCRQMSIQLRIVSHVTLGRKLLVRDESGRRSEDFQNPSQLGAA